jgi:poly-beta-1,6-N-acetyl-D-glucosamine N-deacetylase
LLRDNFRNIFYGIIYFTGLHVIYRWLFQKDKVTILVFHEFSSLYSRKIFKYLNKKYNIISLIDFVNYTNKKESNHISSLKNKLIITIDDGHKSNFKLFNCIKDMNLSMTIFLTTGLVGTKKGFWWNNNKSSHDNEFLKKIPDKERLEILNNYGFNQEYDLLEREALSYEEIIEMKVNFNFQSHSVSHPILINCNDNKVKKEVEDSKLFLEKNYNFNIFAFAYPNGDWTKREKFYVKRAGYKCILTTIHGYNDFNSDIFSLKRISGGTGKSYFETVVKSSGLKFKN